MTPTSSSVSWNALEQPEKSSGWLWLRVESRRRRPAVRSRARWFAVAVLVLVGLLYYRPLHDYFAARAQRADQLAGGREARAERAALERKLRHASSPAALAAEARTLGYIAPRRAPLHRQGHPAVAAQAEWHVMLPAPWSPTLTEPSSHASSDASRAPPPCRRSLPVRRAGRDRAAAVRRVDGDPFPTTYYLTCPHLVAAVSRLEAAGGVERWSAAAREEPALAASLAAATTSSAGSGGSSPAARSEATAVPRLDFGIGGSRRRREPQVPPRPRRLRARASRLRARRAHRSRRSSRCGPIGAAPRA